MTIFPRDEDTICAVSTPHGRGGISVIRVSGRAGEKILKSCCDFLPRSLESHRIYYGFFRSKNKQVIDEVLVGFFKEGRSFTGETVFEISCHGSPFICDEILKVLIELGARPADRGEFTYRAFMNGRIDLTQAEGVLELIESQTAEQKKIALRQLGGQLSQKIRRIEDQITRILAHVEADIDFSTENLETLSRAEATSTLNSILEELRQLLGSYEWGRKIRDGVNVALIGSPNVGKSTLFNLLVGEERAIVTPFAGTTRDVLSEDVFERGLKFSFFDTAGVRLQTNDLIERIGIDRSRKTFQEADWLLFVLDASQPPSAEEIVLASEVPPERVVVVLNKVDLVEGEIEPSVSHDKSWAALLSIFFKDLGFGAAFAKGKILQLSANTPSARAKVFDSLFQEFSQRSGPLDDVVLTSSRHYEALLASAQSISEAIDSLSQHRSLEFVALELKESLLKIQAILGIQYDDQILDRVFKEFCLGK